MPPIFHEDIASAEQLRKLIQELTATYEKLITEAKSNMKTLQEETQRSTKVTSEHVNVVKQEKDRYTELLESQKKILKAQQDNEKAIDRATAARKKQVNKMMEANTAAQKETKNIEEMRKKVSALTLLWSKADMGSKKFKELSTQLNKTTAELKKQEEAVGKNQRSVGNYGKALDNLKGMLKGVGVAMLAAFSFGAIKSFFSSSLQAYEKQVQAVEGLRAQLTASGKDASRLVPDYKKFAAGLQQITKHGDEATLELMRLGETMGVKDIKKATKDAIGLSAALGIDLTAAMKMVALAGEGDYNMLNRYVPALKVTKDATEKAAIATKLFSDGYQIALTQAKEGMGPLTQLENAWGDIKETIGGVIAVAILPAIKGIKDLITPELDLTRSFEDQAQKVIKLQDVVEPLTKEYENLKKKTTPSVEEQNRLKTVITQIATELPYAISKVDEYGVAIDISADAVRDYIEVEKNRLKIMNANEISSIRGAKAINEVNISTWQAIIDGYENNAQIRSQYTQDEVGELKVQLAEMLSSRMGYDAQLKQLSGDFLADMRRKNKERVKNSEDADKKEVKSTEKKINDQWALHQKQLADEIKLTGDSYKLSKELGIATYEEVYSHELELITDSAAYRKLIEGKTASEVLAIWREASEKAKKAAAGFTVSALPATDSDLGAMPEFAGGVEINPNDVLQPDAWQETFSTINEYAQAFGGAITDILNAISASNQANLNQEMEAIANRYELESALLEEQLHNRTISETQYNARKTAMEQKKKSDEFKLQKEYARKQKDIQLTQAIINTALSVTSALTTQPFIVGLILAVVAAAMGAVEIAAISSAQFAKGGYMKLGQDGAVLKGKRHSQGGVNLGEVGTAEAGEYMGIINRPATRKYESELPLIFDSLNKQNFENVFSHPTLTVNVDSTYSKKMYKEMTKDKKTESQTVITDRMVITKTGNHTVRTYL